MAKQIKKETIIQICAIVLAIGAFIGAAVAVSKMISGRNAPGTDTTTYARPTKQAPTLLFDGKYYQMRDNVEVFVIMGIDDRENLGNTTAYINSSQAGAAKKRLVIYQFYS